MYLQYSSYFLGSFSLGYTFVQVDVDAGQINFRFIHVYLNLSSLASHSGALNHLTCLRVLFLHNNQIRGLVDTMHELRRMQQLQTASEYYTAVRTHTQQRPASWV